MMIKKRILVYSSPSLVQFLLAFAVGMHYYTHCSFLYSVHSTTFRSWGCHVLLIVSSFTVLHLLCGSSVAWAELSWGSATFELNSWKWSNGLEYLRGTHNIKCCVFRTHSEDTTNIHLCFGIGNKRRYDDFIYFNNTTVHCWWLIEWSLSC